MKKYIVALCLITVSVMHTMDDDQARKAFKALEARYTPITFTEGNTYTVSGKGTAKCTVGVEPTSGGKRFTRFHIPLGLNPQGQDVVQKLEGLQFPHNPELTTVISLMLRAWDRPGSGYAPVSTSIRPNFTLKDRQWVATDAEESRIWTMSVWDGGVRGICKRS